MTSSAGQGCWCGDTRLASFSPEYVQCEVCETLVTSQMPDVGISRVTVNEEGLYAREYWFSHQETLGQPSILSRSQTDLSERCLHWLRTVLKYKQPPGPVLELGSAHGAFVALLR